MPDADFSLHLGGERSHCLWLDDKPHGCCGPACAWLQGLDLQDMSLPWAEPCAGWRDPQREREDGDCHLCQPRVLGNKEAKEKTGKPSRQQRQRVASVRRGDALQNTSLCRANRPTVPLEMSQLACPQRRAGRGHSPAHPCAGRSVPSSLGPVKVMLLAAHPRLLPGQVPSLKRRRVAGEDAPGFVNTKPRFQGIVTRIFRSKLSPASLGLGIPVAGLFLR